MQLYDLHLGMVLIYFVYGLAFFTMGIALSLEIGRPPRLAERGVVRPLAIFGLLHGIHEWYEIILLQGVWIGMPFPEEIAWFRVGWLAISFVPLVVFGLLVLHTQHASARIYIITGGSLVGLYFVFLGLTLHYYPQEIITRADALARYILAFPGGMLAALALLARAKQVLAENRPTLASHFRWAALGFGLYGLTQVFVPPISIFPANIINVDLFISLTGMPVQVVRAGMAILITLNLIRAIQIVEGERASQLLAAQKSRLEALELLQRDLEEREALRRELLRHTVIAQEEERARLARELHDETAQALTAFSLNLATLRKSLPQKPAVHSLANQLQELSGQMSRAIYRMVSDLRPAQLDDLGLVSALQYLVEECRERLGLNITFETSGIPQRLDPLVETVIFRVSQEALTNISRHAHTPDGFLRLIYGEEKITMQVIDQGVGFDVKQTLSPPRGWGLAGMRERAESLGGQFQLVSAPGKGTTISITIPLGETSTQGKDILTRRE